MTENGTNTDGTEHAEEFRRARCPYCSTETTVHHVVGEGYEWAKIDCPYGHQAEEYNPSEVASFVERVTRYVETDT